MGLVSAKLVIRSRKSSSVTPKVSLNCCKSSSGCGKNSCNGGSSRRMVTGKPAIMVNSSTKSFCCWGCKRSKAICRCLASAAKIRHRISKIRRVSKNICSVRTRPIPWAPKRRARSASAGVSALARTARPRCLSAHCIRLPKSPLSSGSSVGAWPSSTRPEVPSTVITSPSRKIVLPIFACRPS